MVNIIGNMCVISAKFALQTVNSKPNTHFEPHFRMEFDRKCADLDFRTRFVSHAKSSGSRQCQLSCSSHHSSDANQFRRAAQNNLYTLSLYRLLQLFLEWFISSFLTFNSQILNLSKKFQVWMLSVVITLVDGI